MLKKRGIRRLVSCFMAIAVILSGFSTSAFAWEKSPTITSFTLAQGEATAVEPSQDLIDVYYDTENLSIVYQGSDSARSVTSNITLPSRGGNGSTVVWTSNSPFLNDTGVVSAPPFFFGDQYVVLTATLTKGVESFTIAFHLTVKAQAFPIPPIPVPPVTPPTTTLLDLYTDDGDFTLAVGDAPYQEPLWAFYVDGTETDVSSEAQWSSSDESVATAVNGLITPLKAGTVTILAVYENLSISFELVVTDPAIVTDGYTFCANEHETCTFSGTADVAYGAYGVFNHQTATDSIECSNEVFGDPLDGSTKACYYKIIAPTLVTLYPNGDALTFELGSTAYHEVLWATYSDGTRADVGSTAQWSSSDESVAKVVNGDITAVGVGTANITINYQDAQFTVVVTVIARPVTLDVLTINPSDVTLTEGGTPALLTATATYTDESTDDVTSSVEWVSDNPDVAIMRDNSIVPLAEGTATIIAYFGELSETVHVTVLPKPPVPVPVPVTVTGLTANPGNLTVNVGQTQSTVVTATYSNSTTGDVTRLVNWSTANPSIATVANGVVKGVSTGNTVVTAVYQNKVVAIPVTVKSAVVTSLLVSPSTVSLQWGNATNLAVKAVYSDGSTKDVTSSAIYSSLNTGVAVTDSAGKVFASGYGTATILVSYGGQSQTVLITVPQPVVYTGGSGSGSTPTPTPVPVPPVTPKPIPTPDKPSLNDKVSSSVIRGIVDRAKTAPAKKFSDVGSNSSTAKAIDLAARMGIVSGYADGSFNPTGVITRAEFATMFARALGVLPVGNDSFSDVKGHWASGSIQALKASGIISGYGDGSFRPNAQITRAEIVAMLAAVQRPGFIQPTDNFSDIKGNWAEAQIRQAAQLGIISGIGGSTFAPNTNATREQSILMIMRMLNINLDLGLDL